MSRIFRLLAAGLLGPAITLPAALPAPAVVATAAVGCSVDYQGRQVDASVHLAMLMITNTGTEPLEGWTLRFTLPSGQTILLIKGASLETTSGAIVAHDIVTNATVRPGGTVTVSYQASGQATRPAAFTVNSVPCT
ncbi:cellulose binding domain-containing protein [Actinoplanes sp. NPDC051346]|uniref:cellulose binding domain-containing protein n=1 Tax=Actinoplanes sp. NPDC051346 TaxID=3155048 RepID=UPI003416F6B2